MISRRVSPERDNLWRHMSDEELEAAILSAKGRVSIGFKEVGDAEGVDGRGRVLVSSATVGLGKEAIRRLGVSFLYEFDDMPNIVAVIKPSIARGLRRNPMIEYVEPIFPGKRASQDTTWNVLKINAPAAWSSAVGTGQRLLIIDGGIQQNHFDLTAAVVGVCDDTGNTWDSDGHGTNVAGVAAAINNTSGIIGVGHGTALWIAKDGDETPDPVATACGVQFGRANNVAAINISSSFRFPLTALTDQINAAYNFDNIIVAVAVGNDASAVSYPATLSSAIAVSGTTSADGFATFSNYGAKVEISAPAVNIVTTCLANSTCMVAGTSFAAPAVAAAAAVLRSFNPSWTAAEIRRRLAVGATDLGSSGRDSFFGFGRLNILGSINASAPVPPYIGIDGPSIVRPFEECSWTASVSGGVPPFTYKWENGSTLLGTSMSLSFTNSSNSGETFQIRLTVTGADLAETVSLKTVSVSNGAPICAS